MSLLSSGIAVKISEIKSMSWDISEVTVAPRPYHALIFRKKGDADFSYGQKQIHTGCKEVFYMPANLEYHAIYKEANSIAVIHFDSDYKGDAENFKTTAPEIIETLFDRVIDIWDKKEPGYFYSALSVIYEILSNLQKSNSDSVNTTLHSDFLSAVKYADTHFTDPSLSVDMLAKNQYNQIVLLERRQPDEQSNRDGYVPRNDPRKSSGFMLDFALLIEGAYLNTDGLDFIDKVISSEMTVE